MGDGRLHAYAEHIEFEQPHVLDVVFVEMTHAIPGSAGFDRSAIEQCGIGEHHPARMHGDIAG